MFVCVLWRTELLSFDKPLLFLEELCLGALKVDIGGERECANNEKITLQREGQTPNDICSLDRGSLTIVCFTLAQASVGFNGRQESCNIPCSDRPFVVCTPAYLNPEKTTSV